jgi:hypothetical protein
MYVLAISGSGPPSMTEIAPHVPRNRQVAPIAAAAGLATNARTHLKYPDRSEAYRAWDCRLQMWQMQLGPWTRA